MSGIRVRDDRNGVRFILLDRPETRNALDAGVVAGISAALSEAPGTVVVLGSTDSNAFCSGADIHIPDGERAAVSDSLYALYKEMRASAQVIVAAASGPAVGGGAQLLLASDIRVVAPDASIRFLGVGHGLVVGAWGLPSLVGRGRAMDLCLSMRTLDGHEALAMGLADRVAAQPLDFASEYAARLSDLDPSVVGAVKRIVSAESVDQALDSEHRRNSGWNGRVVPP